MDRRKAAKFIYNLSIDTTYTNAVGRRHYKVKGLTNKSASQIQVEIDGKKTTVAEYFKKTYNLKLAYPNLPCITSGATGKVMIPLVFELLFNH
jgi:eukaryotic translation initiation factor 2C